MEHMPHQHGEIIGFDQLSSHLEAHAHFQIIAEIFKQLGDPTRVRIFWLLCHCESCVINIASMMHMSSPAVSHHLRALKNTGLIISRRVGKEVYYKAADTQQSQLLHHMMEKVMEIACPSQSEPEQEHVHTVAPNNPSHAEQLEVVKQVHDYLMHHMDQRFTIEQLSKQFLLNPTALKTTFKQVYGESLATHVKNHKLAYAAKLLSNTQQSISEIASAIGYESQSKFSAAFKEQFGIAPTEYRKQN